jgi:hypothetical protein
VCYWFTAQQENEHLLRLMRIPPGYLSLRFKTTIMKTAVSFLLIVLLMACNSGADKPGSPKAGKSKKSKPSPEDSYTGDTLYQALPGLLQDLSASQNMEDLLAQNWINADDKEALEYADGSSVEFPVRSFSMSTDKTVVKNIRNYMETGTWKFDADAKTITFSYKGGSADKYKIRALAADELRLTNTGINSETILVFVADGKTHKDLATDPFHIANNKWRIAPKASETDEAIRQRVKEYLHFFILYYKDVIARRAAIVSFYGFPGCLKWYAGGIYIEKDEAILKDWESCFYNKAQAQKGLDMVSKLLDKKYTWPTGNENWIKKNLVVLEQLYSNL